jgi:hypothetical protein
MTTFRCIGVRVNLPKPAGEGGVEQGEVRVDDGRREADEVVCVSVFFTSD